MKNLTDFRGDIWSISQTILQYSLAIRVGYPNYAVNKNAFVGFEEEIDQRARQLLIKEDFEDDHIFFFLLNQLAEYFDVFSRIDIQAGNWLLQRNQVAPKELWKKFKSEVHLAAIDEIIQKGVVLPNWLEDPEYQEYLLQAIPILERILNTVETIEDQILLFPKNNQNETVLLSYEWELRQKLKFLHLVMLKGIEQALPDILEIKQTERNPLGWITEDFSQRIDDKIDEAAATDPEEAIRILKSVFRLKPKTVQACSLYYDLAMNYENLERWEEAIDAYTKMNEVAPPNGVSLFYRAQILHHLGRDAEAKMDLEQALSLPPLHIYVLDEEQKKKLKTSFSNYLQRGNG
jgi:tetratricopeptide (TPR) repeat protein